MATLLTFTGAVDPDWIDTATDAPDPRQAGVQTVIAMSSEGGTVLLVQWVDGADPDPSYVEYWTERAASLGLTAGPVSIGTDTTVVEYVVLQQLNTVKGVPCILTRRAS